MEDVNEFVDVLVGDGGKLRLAHQESVHGGGDHRRVVVAVVASEEGGSTKRTTCRAIS